MNPYDKSRQRGHNCAQFSEAETRLNGGIHRKTSAYNRKNLLSGFLLKDDLLFFSTSVHSLNAGLGYGENGHGKSRAFTMAM
jgi:hypothetical protein